MKNRLRAPLSILAIAALSGGAVNADAQSLRLSRPSNHMQTGGVDYSDQTQAPVESPGQMQSASMDSTGLKVGAGQNTLRGGALDNGTNMPLAAAAMDSSNPLQKLSNFLVGGSRQLSGNELANLSRHDIVLLIDKSSSMAEVDCLSMDRRWGMISRWDWCREQTTDFAQQTAAVLPHGISVLLFSWSTRIFPHVDVMQVPRIFSDNHPDGVTNEDKALGAVLDDYFQRRDAAHGKVAPLLVAVITDGRPTNETAVRNIIKDATFKMQSPDEIKITFLLIGQDTKGLQFIQEMDKGLVSQGAKFDIVASRPFRDLVRTGLASAVAESLAEQPDHPGMLDMLNDNKHRKH